MISRHHRPDFSVWDARTDLARCHTCGQPVNAATWVRTECQGSTGIRANTEGCPVVSPMAAVPDPEGEQPIDGGPVTVAPLSAKHPDQLNALRSVDVRPVQAEGSCSESREPGHLDPVTASPGRSESATGHAFLDTRDLERERTMMEIRRCAEHQW